MNKKPLVIYHANCADGFSAAWCFHHFLADCYDFHPGVYSDCPPDVKGRNVYLVDFSYKRAVVAEMIKDADGVFLIDHHKTAIEDLADLDGLGFYTDVHRSGAALAWDFLFGTTTPRPRLLEHVQDRDLWRFRLPMTREIQANVFSYEYTFETWDKLMALEGLELAEFAGAGAALERKHFKDINELLAVCRRDMTIDGVVVPCASLPYTMSSDAGHIMSKLSLTFAACYWDTAEHRIFSLRSDENGMDVSEVAKSYGGGGHKHAAGFRVTRDHPLAVA